MYVPQTSTFNQTNPSIVPANLQMASQNSSIITDITNLVLAVDGNLTFQDNMAGVFVSYVSGTSPTTPVAVNHTLGSIPIGFLTTMVTSPAVIYSSGTSNWTASTIYLSSSTTTTATLFLIPGG